MVKAWQTLIVLLGVWAAAQPLVFTPVEADLSPFFYLTTCPQVLEIVATGVYSAIQQEARNAASLLRLHFHDCFVQGCDGSILLNATATNPSEKDSPPNKNSVRGFPIIDSIKASLESSCPGVVSCADIVTLAAFFSVVLSGGPIWVVSLGRRDSFLANFNASLTELINPASDIATIKKQIFFQNLTVTDLVALSGAHTIGLARCVVVTQRIYNFSDTGLPDPTLNKTRLQTLETTCPRGGDGNVTNPMDLRTPTVFDNLYYQNLILANGLFASDQELYDAANDTNALVKLYASDQFQFFVDFSTSMINMGNLNVLTGTAGEVRKNCAVRNPVKELLEEVVNSESEEASAEKEWTEPVERSESYEHTESAVEYFKEMVTKVVKDIATKELEKLVEDTVRDTVNGGHFSM